MLPAILVLWAAAAVRAQDEIVFEDRPRLRIEPEPTITLRADVPTTCSCVQRNTCYQAVNQNDGSGLIDFRIVTTNDTTVPLPTTTPLPNSTSCVGTQDYCCTGTSQTGCGTRLSVPLTPATTPGPGQARYGSQPWQAIIMALDNTIVGGGVLVDSATVVTAAHKVFNRTATGLKVKVGVWDLLKEVDPFKSQEVMVSAIRVHPGFCVNCTLATQNLMNGIAVLKLTMPVQMGVNPNINTACLPISTAVFDSQYCLVYGWGKDSFTGIPQNIPKEVEVPVIPNTVCQDRLRATRLGATFTLNPTSFLCAGGEPGKDACTGDGGSGLVCLANGRYQLVGIVAWGIGCATGNVPGVYIRVPTFTDWIRAQITA